MKSAIVSLSLATLASASVYGESNLNHTCFLTDASKVLSCSANANPASVDSCCAETYGGLFLSTQFWDTYTGLESQGQLLPEDTWTLHGLWPDFCNGSYTQYCDLNRQYDPSPSPKFSNGAPVPAWTGAPISTFVEQFGKFDLLNWMNTYWINQGAPNSDFWAHEFSKHGTCFSTFDVPCYGPKYVQNEDVIDFFESAIKYYQRLPTAAWLKAAHITPSNTTTYTIKDVQGALSRRFGATPYIGCSGPRYNTTAEGAGSLDNGKTVISEVWYYFHAYGKPQDGNWKPVDASGSSTSCATTKHAVHYYERTPGSERAL